MCGKGLRVPQTRAGSQIRVVKWRWKGREGAGRVSGRTLEPPGNEGLQGPLEVSSHDQTLKVRGSPSPGFRESTGKFSESLHPGCTPVPVIQSGRDREVGHDPSIMVSVKAPHVPPPHPKGSEALLLGPESGPGCQPGVSRAPILRITFSSCVQ